MTDSALAQATYHELRPKLLKKEISAVEIAKSVLSRIESVDSKVGSFLTVCPEVALKQAKAVDDKIAKGEKVGALAGMALAPKDIYLTKGVETTCASQILKGYIPPYEGTVIEKCFAADAVMVGKVNLDEFAMGSSTENSSMKVTKNPWDLTRVPGGSSGGSAAAVASDCCTASLGTDTGGSIRQPASLCGIVGLKPTYGRVSRYGVIAFASSLDQMGPMTKDVEDAAILMNVMAGHDPHDTTSANVPVPDFTQFLNRDIKGLKIGIPKEYFIDGIDTNIRDAVKKAISVLEGQGAIVSEVSLPHTDYASAVYYIVAPAEASSNLARFDGIRYGLRAPAQSLNEVYENSKSKGFGSEVKRRIMLGTYVLSSGYYDAYYKKAKQVQTLIRQDFLEVFKKVDVLATPTSPCPAFKIGERSADPIQMYLADICTIPVNLAGLPGISLPCGFDANQLPIGLQFIGKHFDEGTLLQVAHAYEKTTDWRFKKPVL